MCGEEEIVKKNLENFVKEKRKLLSDKLESIKSIRLKYYKDNIDKYRTLSLNKFVSDMILDKKSFEIKKFNLDKKEERPSKLSYPNKSQSPVKLKYSQSEIFDNKPIVLSRNTIDAREHLPSRNTNLIQGDLMIETGRSYLKNPSTLKRVKSAFNIESKFLTNTFLRKYNLREGRNKSTIMSSDKETINSKVNLVDYLAYDTIFNQKPHIKFRKIVKSHEQIKKESLEILKSVRDKSNKVVNKKSIFKIINIKKNTHKK